MFNQVVDKPPHSANRIAPTNNNHPVRPIHRTGFLLTITYIMCYNYYIVLRNRKSSC